MPDLHLDELCINTIRLLAVDAVEQANSGHPGTSMGAAPMAYVLWDRFLKHNPADPQWPDRDRFVLSPGHASAMLYALLHLTGYDLPLEELKRFRQWESKAPGHPEYGQTPGVEVTTGPLGQGFAHGVGMAVAERWLAEHYNRPGHEIINHYTYAIVSDGDLQEGVASEAASLAGTLRLGKLIYLYDDNDVSIEGNTDIGSADLAPSTYTLLKDHGHYGFEEYCGHNMHFGVREHAMGAIVGGMALHGGTIPYTATFLIFSDYMRPPMRLAALMGQRVIYIFTHDSIGLGEDGPTHQPIEQLMSLRAIPKLVVLRPADATETVEAWKVALERRDGPTAFVFGRQNLPVLNRTTLASAMGVRRGGYILWEASSRTDTILIATGSEIHIALEAGRLLAQEGVAARVVSLPSWEIFDTQPREYRDQVLPPDIRARVSIEAASPLGWERYVGLDGVAMGLPHFGASAPASVLYQKFGLTAERVATEAKVVLGRLRR